MPRREEKLSDVLLKAPWWVSVIFAIAVFVGLRWVAPAMLANNKIGQGFAVPFAAAAPWLALFFLMLAAGSAILSAKKRKLVDSQTSLDSLRGISWKEFEWMVGEAYRRLGYTVEDSLGSGADGGIDLTLRRGSETIIVQCKQWKVFSVGAPVVREMYGLLNHHQASRAIIITSGKFTAEAKAFAVGKPIELVDGRALLVLVQGVQRTSKSEETVPTAPPAAHACPKCGSTMIKRTAKRGANAGNSFWGCSTYPACNGTRDFVAK